MLLAVFFFSACNKEQQQGNLIIYTYDTFPDALEESIKTALETEGTAVNLIRFEDTGGLMAQVLLEKDKPKADVVIGLDNTYLARAFDEDLFQVYKPAGLKLVHEGLVVDPEYRLIPFDYGSIALNYDSKLLPDPPSSWQELLDPAYKDKIILMNPSTSSPGRNFLLFTIAEFGEDGFLDFWNSLKPNILTVASGWSEGYGLYTQGEAPIVLSYDTSPAYHLQFEETDRYKNLIFDGRAYAQVEVAGILKGSPHLKLAKRCMDHLVSQGFQDLIPLNQIMYPIHPDAKLPDSFVQAAGATEIVNMDESLVAEKLNGWLTAWEDLMRRP
jgi:thiamine transport system substrate-binding protein